MAEQIETVEYLCDEVGARPTGTEEEQLAALYIAEKLREETALNAIVEDFACPSNPAIVKIICFGVGILAAILSMVLPSLGIVWTIIAAAVAAIYALENLKGMSIISRLFRNGISQNVVAKYSPEGASSKRKIVLVTSYDTGKDLNGVKKGPIADNIVKIQWACLGGLIASPIFLLIHTVFFASTTGGVIGFFNFLSVICIILMALPLIGVILEGRAPYSQGANNNATGVSVLLDVATKVVDGAMADEEAEIEGEEAAREADAIPEGAEVEYEAPVTQRSLTPEQSLAAAKAAIAAMTGKPIADKVPFTDITTHLVHGDGFDDYNQPVNVRFEVSDEPAEITHQSYFGDFDYEQAAYEDEARGASRPASKPVAAPVPTPEAVAQESQEPMVQEVASEPVAETAEQEDFVRQTPEEIIAAEPSFNEDLNPNIPSWARSAQAKARANRPDLAAAKPAVSRSRFADTVAARLTEESINGTSSTPTTPVFVSENQTELQARLAELREDIETVASSYAEQVDQNVAAAQEVIPAEEPAVEPVVEAAPANVVSRETVEAPVQEQPAEPVIIPAPVQEPEPQAEDAEEIMEEPQAGRGNRVVTPITLPSMTPEIKVAEIEPSEPEAEEVETAQEEILQESDEAVDYGEYAEDIQEASEEQGIEDVIESFDRPAQRTPRRRSVRGASAEPEAVGIAGKFSAFTSKFGKSLKDKTSSFSFGKRKEQTFEEEFDDDFDDVSPSDDLQPAQAFTLRDSSKAGRVAIGGPAADTNEELIEEEVNPESTASLSPMDVSAFLNDVEVDDDMYEEDFDDEYVEEEFQQPVEDFAERAKTEAELQEEVARKIAAADTNPVSLEDIMSAVQMEMDSERTGIPIPKEAVARNNALNLPRITGSFAAVQAEEPQKPVILPTPSAQAPAQQAPSALVSSMIPRIGADGKPVAQAPAPAPEPAPAPAEDLGQTQMFAPQQEEEYYGEFPAPVVEETPKRGFFSRFRKNKKQEDDMGVAAWIGADEDYSAREVGRQRGSWESFKQDDVDDYAPTTRFAPVEDDGFAPVDNGDFAPVDNSGFAPINNDNFAPIDNDGFAPIEYNNSAFRNPRDWNGGGLSLDRLKGMAGGVKDKMPSLPGRKKVEQDEEAPSGRSSRGGATSGRAGRSTGRTSGRVRPSMDAATVDGELKKINSFKNGAVDTEIWFVALGSTIPNNAGMKAFLDEHGDELKGATIINIEALGAGSLSFIQHEGRYKGVQATSRFKRYLRQASQASGVSFSTAKLNGVDTPATVAMQRGYQAVSLIGMEKGKKALASSEVDIVENIDPQTLKDNTNFVLNLLKSI